MGTLGYMEGPNEMSVPGVRSLCVPCSDLGAMRHFYTQLVGLNEIYQSIDDRTLAYDCQGLQFTIFEATAAAPGRDGWARQPGWVGGTGAAISWSVVLTEATYGKAVRRLLDFDVTRRHDEPQWVNYWSLAVQDPAGNTVEITYAPSEPLARLTWSG